MFTDVEGSVEIAVATYLAGVSVVVAEWVVQVVLIVCAAARAWC